MRIDNGNKLILTGHVVPDTASRTIWPEASVIPLIHSRTLLTVSSTSANDSSTGTGARSVRIYGFLSTGEKSAIDVNTSGQTGVSIGDGLVSISHAEVTYGTNAGIIRVGSGTITAGVPAIVYDHIAIGEGSSQSIRFTVPKGKNLHVKKICLSRKVPHELVVTIKRTDPRTSIVLDQFVYTSGLYTVEYDVSIVFKENETFTVEASNDSGSGEELYAKAFCELS